MLPGNTELRNHVTNIVRRRIWKHLKDLNNA